MKHLPQRVAALLLAAVMSLTLTGCVCSAWPVEDLFTPAPGVGGIRGLPSQEPGRPG